MILIVPVAEWSFMAVSVLSDFTCANSDPDDRYNESSQCAGTILSRCRHSQHAYLAFSIVLVYGGRCATLDAAAPQTLIAPGKAALATLADPEPQLSSTFTAANLQLPAGWTLRFIRTSVYLSRSWLNCTLNRERCNGHDAIVLETCLAFLSTPFLALAQPRSLSFAGFKSGILYIYFYMRAQPWDFHSLEPSSASSSCSYALERPSIEPRIRCAFTD